MDTATTHPHADRGDAGASQAERKALRSSRCLTLTTLVIALAGFAGTAFSAVPHEMFCHPATFVVSH